MLNVTLVGMRWLPPGARERRIPVRRSCGFCPQARALFKPVAAFLRAAWLRTAAGSSGAALAGVAALLCTV